MIGKDKIPKSLLPIVEDRLEDLDNEKEFPPPALSYSSHSHYHT